MLDKAFESPIPVIAALDELYASIYGFEGEIMLVTPTNREAVFMELLKKAAETPKRPAAKKEKPAAKKAEKKKAKAAPKKKEEAKPAKKIEVKKQEKPAEEKHHEAEHKPPRKGALAGLRNLLGF
jgi:outer membrane biosynthesis protein TonB